MKCPRCGAPQKRLYFHMIEWLHIPDAIPTDVSCSDCGYRWNPQEEDTGLKIE